MVNSIRNLRLVKDQSGTALTEGLLVFPLMVLAVSVCLEFGYILHQWNLGAKAMQLGVRKLIVSEPVSPDFYSVFAQDQAQDGSLITANAGVNSVCGAGSAAVCDKDMMKRIVYGGAGDSWLGLHTYFPDLSVEDIKITYELSGLGYQGRPGGTIVSVRMELVREASDLPITGTLLGLLNINFPAFAVTATSEDLQSCPSGCSADG